MTQWHIGEVLCGGGTLRPPEYMNKKISKWIRYSLLPLAVLALIVWAATRPRPGEDVSSQGNRHLKTAEETHNAYNSTPPTSGPHVNQKANWGVYANQIADELQVHNLEDGGVIVHHDPAQVDQTTIESLATIVQSYSDKVILEQYANLEAPIVLTAWTKIDMLATFDETRIIDFIEAYRGIDHH